MKKALKNRKRHIIRQRKRQIMTYMSIILCGAMLLSSHATVYAGEGEVSYREYRAGAVDAAYPEEEGSYTVISISSEEDLVNLAMQCQLDSWSRDKYVVLEEDIVLEENRELMIPSFGGIFDGGGHEISHLELTAAGSSVGLFRYLQEGGIVRNLNLSGRVHPQGTGDQAGLLVGVNYGCITDCHVSGSVAGNREIGGLAGVNEESGQIRNCSSQAVVTGTRSVGGICGSNLGTLNHCDNSGSINIYTREVIYDIEDLSVEMLEDTDSVEDMGAHMDTGGIAGYCEGKIYYCTNTGTVGYQHVGYNTGGIVGRLHQGYLQNCTNSGHVLGRKDVGGIAGQMEPFLEVQYLADKLGEIDREAEKLLDLMEAAHEDLSAYGSQASALSKALTANVRNVNTAAGNLTSTANDLWYIYNQELTGVGNDLRQLGRDLENQGTSDKENGNYKDLTVSGGDITIQVPDDTASYRAALRRFGDNVGGHVTNMTNASNDRSGGITGNLETLNKELEAAGNHLDQLSSVLEQGMDKTTENVDAIFDQAKVLRKLIRQLRDDLFRYEGIAVSDASDEKPGNGTGEAGSGQETESSAEEEGSGQKSESVTAEVPAYYDTDSFQQGKVTLCVNRGLIEADTNVGGIVGQVATEYDFDPEEDITFTGAESFNIEQTVKAVIRESINQGDVISKKDYVGGIVGKADHGAVISCESYGNISSTGGSFVGGIAGSSSYCVRNCYFLGQVSGKNYVGGIAGKGADIFYSYAYPALELTGECAGSIAGSLEEEGILYGNYYVEGSIPGVDSIGYEGGATPLSYQEFCSGTGVPAAFSEFRVVFQAEGKELASFTCHYGDFLDESLIPEVPEKEGCYGFWPEFDNTFITGSRILEPQYEKWVSSLVSGADESGRSEVLVQGEFLPGMELELIQRAEGTEISIVSSQMDGEQDMPASSGQSFGRTEPYAGALKVRVLCGEDMDPEKIAVELYGEDGAYREVPAEVIGSYLEFDMEKPGIFRLTEKEDTGKLKVVAAVGGVLGAVLLGILIGRYRKKRKRGSAAAESNVRASAST